MAALSGEVNLQHILSACVHLADQSGAIVRSIFDSGNLQATDKSNE